MKRMPQSFLLKVDNSFNIFLNACDPEVGLGDPDPLNGYNFLVVYGLPAAGRLSVEDSVLAAAK